MRLVTLPVALVVALSTATAHAEGPVAVDPDTDALERLAWLERVIDREAFATRAWRGSWLAFYGGAAALEGVLAGTSKSPGPRLDSIVNAGKAGVAFVFVLVSPASAGPRADRLRLLAGRADVRARLRVAEASLRAIADEERDRRGWFPLVGGAVLNAAGAWVDWAGHRGNGALGWIGLASGIAVAQIQFHTQPTGALRAWEAYQRAGSGARLGDPPPVLRWSVRPWAGGAAVEASF